MAKREQVLEGLRDRYTIGPDKRRGQLHRAEVGNSIPLAEKFDTPQCLDGDEDGRAIIVEA